MSAAKRFSPGAALLRRSRLLSMPAPVPSPPSYFLINPDVAPHPTVQAVTTPASSHARGNWGLKRDLPTKTRYPFLRYTALDTLEHFTTYESAADDVLTLKKWQEMDVPVLQGPTVDTSALASILTARHSVFKFSAEAPNKENYTWRFRGPYVPDMSAGEFARYIDKQVKPRRAEFLEFYSPSTYTPATGAPAQADPPALHADTDTPTPTPTPDVDAPVEVDLLALRADVFLLGRLVVAFLDLPTLTRPHRTHPSGGLHYTRSTAAARYDPLLGPRAETRPVTGRYLNYTGAYGTMIGVGGFVAKSVDAMRLDDPLKLYNNRQHTRKYVPDKARLDALGRVLLDVETLHEDGSGGGRSVYDVGGGGGDAAALLRGFGATRRWDSLYNADKEINGPGAAGQQQQRGAGMGMGMGMGGGYGGGWRDRGHTEAIMDLLDPSKRSLGR
ncbi:mitochondrial ribosomal protein subunit-domain-containing protein [Morchella snyderi]|nr:mitochondrial ribosomal protein subunit-domain-containing protein [Morchella snyderi]